MTTFRVNRRGTPEAGAIFPKLNYAIKHMNGVYDYEGNEGDVEMMPDHFFIFSTYQGHVTRLRIWECARRPVFFNESLTTKTPS